ncbi:hypothetical protein C5F59_018090 [Streptomyces sp. QL37]|uniref:hypothetical protein n=1 Tax=Streptomyces sp. QL37 TaxID=2093747 RepID=UPI000CF274CF|nr:hypothetical protein [Streptomyces sp. QL37]PPQ62426.1 hypothetical protein C5F59_20475 [Streptomyces sp. QL37]
MAVAQGLSEPAGPQGGDACGPRLKHSDGPWLRAAGGAAELATHLAPVRGELALAHQGLMAGAGRLTALAELAAVRESWERRIQAAQGECGSLAAKLRDVARTQGATNEAVRASFAAVRPCGGEER